MRTATYVAISTLTLVAAAAACSSNKGNNNGNLGFGGSAGDAGAAGAGSLSASGGTGNNGSGGSGIQIDGSVTEGGATGGGTGSCVSGPDEDKDQDGWSKNQGDCNDCDEAVNPGAIDVLNTADGGSTWGDEDCDGTPGSSGQTTCDDGLPLDYMDPLNAAKAIELCKQTTVTDKTYGLIEAKWVRADGSGPYTPGYNAGIQQNFGPNVNVQMGKSMLSISSGHARIPGQPNACGSNTCSTSGPGTPPPGFPQDSPNCNQDPNINDDIALEVRLRAPTNATGYKFDFKFYSFEYPEWVCTSYNDQFIALVNPAPAGAVNGNISFDSQNNPVSVNVAFFNAPFSELQGTGFDGVWFDDAGATVWLQTQAPVNGGEEISIRFAIWDTGDDAWDSTALIDNFQWIATGGTVDIGTTPIPVPQ